ncbi:glycoside hydrolase family 127 protein [Pedobacter hiemivivus]|uniref:Glycoside hydrolase family 127 protein n=1 Tax=Pedobacter hiemivivus TaxID=2530454 RepID=A0A4R0NIG4_9SPHI|nr:beta-L-arabinofuranosidase domain-containing protein [Pedobacter hiemivivus]TCC99152.1 hypothetical protein EZ444_00255 [Pedobacter hiemivivus]
MAYYSKYNSAKLIAVLLISWVSSTAQKPSLIQDQLKPAISAQIQGFAGQEFGNAYTNRILAQDADRLIEPFKNRTETRCWQSEFWGKWFTSAVLAYKYRPEPQLKAILDQSVAKLMATQSPDGYIGNYTEKAQLEQWDIWGRKYCLLGLLSYYDLTHDSKTLKAAKALADHLIKELGDRKVSIVKKGNHRGMAATSILEPICLLYCRTGEKRYLDFAEEIVAQWESEGGPMLIAKSDTDVAKRFPKPAHWFGWEQGQKAYEMMSCYEGLLELYRLTAKPEYKAAVEKTWANIQKTEINIAGSGSSVECWFGGKDAQALPINHYQETCVTATWIKLSQQLLKLTADSKYADAIEQTFYNALLGAMKPDGSDWAKYSPLAGHRLEGGEQCDMGLNCCVASGPRGLFTLPLTGVMSSTTGLQVNFFMPGTYQLRTPKGQAVELIQQTDYPVSGKVTFKINVKKPESFALGIRIPAWSKQNRILVNGKTIDGIVPGKYMEITRTWTSTDIISLELDMQGKLIYMGEKSEHFAIIRGPITLARDLRLGGPNIDDALTPIADKDGFVDLQPVGTSSEGFWMKFKTMFKTESHKEGPNEPISVLLCDYASAGNTNTEASRFRVWLPKLIDPRN